MTFTRHLPKFPYNGLTIILSNGSRFDKHELLSGTGGHYFNYECLAPQTNRWCCDIRLANDLSPIIKGTKCILLLGDRALHLYTNTANSLGEQRGSPLLTKDGIPAIASFLPQDAMDVQAYEKQFNPEAEGYTEDGEAVAKDYTGDKSHSKTSRSNWRFWLKHDTKKLLTILQDHDGVIPQPPYKYVALLNPPLDHVVNTLKSTKNGNLYIDIETDFISKDMRCFAFSFGPDDKGNVEVLIVPFLDISYEPAYGMAGNAKILAALAIAMRDNCTVAHNGAQFDFFVFAHKYHLPIGRHVYDTMIAQHRIYPEVEKSLGHCVSMWTYEPYHKSEAVHTYRTQEQANKLYLYCGKDVYTMVLIHEAQLRFAKTMPGMSESIAQAMSSIRPYLITTLTGIRYNENARAEWVKQNDRLLTQYMRIIKILTGPKVEPLISNQKCVKYFHTQLGYSVVKKSKKTGAPSLDEKALLKLKLKYNNPVIDLLIAYRQKQKEVGALTFTPWKT